MIEEYAERDCGYHTPCWVWQRGKMAKGYGMTRVEGENLYAHRVYYERHVGPIPEGLEIDHLCRVRACVNPEHLEAVTQYENWRRGESLSAQNARKTHCKRGHPFSGDNVYYRPDRPGQRHCNECRRQQLRERRRKAREAAAAEVKAA